MNLKLVKKIGRHDLMIDEHSLELILIKNYQNQAEEILNTLKVNNQISHIPHIISIDNQSSHLVTYEEYIKGQSLRDLISNCDYVTETQFRLYLTNLITTLVELHKLNILHKDIKPENIIINNNGAFLIDFDISRQYKESKQNDTNLLGTKGYASPEQFGFAQTTDKSDIYSLGVTILELLEITILEPKKYQQYLNLANTMTKIDSKLRPTAEDVLLNLQAIYSKPQNQTTSKPKYQAKPNLNSNYYWLPFVLTGKGALATIAANFFLLVMTNEFLQDKSMIPYEHYPALIIICTLFSLSVTNWYVHRYTIPFMDKRLNKYGKIRYGLLWTCLRLTDYLVYSICFIVLYSIASIVLH